jgi:glycosyltransferase involved in cell wall biosynthesis
LISVLILTKNEAADLPGCLESVSWSDDVHLVDSGSVDDTCAIAARYGAKVAVKAYAENSKLFGGDEAAHRNWSIRETSFKHPWVLLLDADERVSAELEQSVRQAVARDGSYAAYRVQRRDFLRTRWLKHVQASPYYIRLFRPERIRYERVINPITVVDGPVGEVAGYLDHYPFSKGMRHWFERHNAYSSLEAAQIMANRRAGARFSLMKAFFSRDFHERRYHQKEVFYRMPLRPLAKFMLLYVAKLGFLDGRAGLQYALLQSIYEYMIVLKVRELESSSS